MAQSRDRTRASTAVPGDPEPREQRRARALAALASTGPTPVERWLRLVVLPPRQYAALRQTEWGRALLAREMPAKPPHHQ